MENDENKEMLQLNIQEKKIKNKFYSWNVLFPLIITIITVLVSIVTTKITIKGNLQQDKEKFTQENIISLLNEKQDIVEIRKKILFLCESGLFSENKVSGIKASLDKYLIEQNESAEKLLEGLEIYDRVNYSINPLFYRRDLLKAIGLFSQAIELDPSNIDAIYYRGISNYYLGVDYDVDLPQKKALNDFNYLLTYDSINSKYYYWRGKTYYDLKIYDKALNDLSMSINFNSNDEYSYIERAYTYLSLKDTLSARNDFKIAQGLINEMILNDSTYKYRNKYTINETKNMLETIYESRPTTRGKKHCTESAKLQQHNN